MKDGTGEGPCPWWLAYGFDNPLRRLIQNPERIVSPWLKQGMTALDLGCGMGFYSIAMAGMVGPAGRVIAVDLQPQMLAVMKKRAARKGLAERITPVRAEPRDIRVEDKVDFAMAMWMVHEVPDQVKFLNQVRACLKQDGRFLAAEPRRHVPRPRFEAFLETAAQCGLEILARPRVGWSHAAVFKVQ